MNIGVVKLVSLPRGFVKWQFWYSDHLPMMEITLTTCYPTPRTFPAHSPPLVPAMVTAQKRSVRRFWKPGSWADDLTAGLGRFGRAAGSKRLELRLPRRWSDFGMLVEILYKFDRNFRGLQPKCKKNMENTKFSQNKIFDTHLGT